MRAVAPPGSTVVDLFCGSGTVSAGFRQAGLRVVANDHLAFCSALAGAHLLNNGEPDFRPLAKLLGKSVSSYATVIEHLNSLPPKRGFVWRTYSPASSGYAGVKRMYFTEQNSARVDAVREVLDVWQNYLSPGQYLLLLADLLMAAARVSNIAGTYGAFLKQWKKRATEPMQLRPRRLLRGRSDNIVTCADAAEVGRSHPAPVAYLDPPYTKRQYAAYYHVLDTIARNDNPIVSGITGLRVDWTERNSPFCHRRNALVALSSLVDGLVSKEVFLSYNEDGQISFAELEAMLSSRGHLKVDAWQQQRYRSNQLGHKGPHVTEWLFHLTRVD